MARKSRAREGEAMITNVVIDAADLPETVTEPVIASEPEPVAETTDNGFAVGQNVTIVNSSFRGLIGVTGEIIEANAENVIILVNGEKYLFSTDCLTRV